MMQQPPYQGDEYGAVFERAVLHLAGRYREAVAAGTLTAEDPVPCTDEERQHLDAAERAVNEAYASRYHMGVDETTGHQIIVGTVVPVEAFRHLVGVWWRIQDACLKRVLGEP